MTAQTESPSKLLLSQSLTRCAAWKTLATHYKRIRDLHFRDLVAEDPRRGERMAIEAAGMYHDYSQNRITDETFHFLLQLAEERNLRGRKRDKLAEHFWREPISPQEVGGAVVGKNPMDNTSRRAQRTGPELDSPAEPVLHHDSSTNNLISRYLRVKAAA